MIRFIINAFLLLLFGLLFGLSFVSVYYSGNDWQTVEVYILPFWSAPHTFSVILFSIWFFVAFFRFKYSVEKVLFTLILFDSMYEAITTFGVYLPAFYLYDSDPFFWHKQILIILLLTISVLLIIRFHVVKIRRSYLWLVFYSVVGSLILPLTLVLTNIAPEELTLVHWEDIPRSEIVIEIAFLLVFILTVYPNVAKDKLSRIDI